MKVSWVVLGAAVAVSLGGCGSRDREREPAGEIRREPERQRRVIEPPVGIVRALPPHAIRADGVGPYRLGEKLSSVLDQLPSGPRIALFEIPGILHRSLIRAEDDTVLVGGEPGGVATFVAVVGSEVARTESGIHVGSTREDLVRVLGPAVVEPERARDPRLYVPESLPSARCVLEAGAIAAIVIAGPVPLPRRGLPPVLDAGAAEPGCTRPAARDQAFGACLSPAGELVTVGATEITLRGAETERPLPTVRLPSPIVFAAAVRTDGRDELAVVTRTEEGGGKTWWLAMYRLAGPRMVPSLEPARLYTLSPANAAWIGSELGDIELYLELTAGPDAIEVGGLLTTRGAGQGPPPWRDVVVISPVMIPRRPQARPASTDPAEPLPAADAGVPVDARRAADAHHDHAPDAAEPDAGAPAAAP